MKITAWFDGSCEPRNPGGTMRYGSFIKIDNKEAATLYGRVPLNGKDKSLGTNNWAEHYAAQRIIEWLIQNNHQSSNITIYGDSNMAVNQLLGKWKIKSGAYAETARESLILLNQFKVKPVIQWIPREQNEIADALSKLDPSNSSG